MPVDTLPCFRIYEKGYVAALSQLRQYYSHITLPKTTLETQNDVVQKITPSELKGAIQRIPSAKAYDGDGFPIEFYKTFC
ncbi:hypothetical protein NDU88_003563 [Pleurodeles waltl]|uniref:Uncharacterized protein n=1 Tax=Pleurodeles waltl TaxID=8319 RepID=A0AAV7V246_PLEWA|nr:hypothetical protein NDU88_003563 [Pleurodeles waltl]